MINKAENKKVLVAMSGGVDSSVSAALLKRAGFDVVGAFMKCWDGKDNCCTVSDDEVMARRAAVKIGISLYVFDFVKAYKKRVFSYFLKEYENGRTPNPDTLCNKEIKFGLFYDKAMQLGFDAIATGHYARVKKTKTGIKLLRAKDLNKDQSYFLYELPIARLEKVLFPVGNYLKTEVRRMARAFGLPNAQRKESQGLCFVGNVHVHRFLKKYIKTKPGKIVTPEGVMRGRHEGLAFYTVGQRKGIGLSNGPFYVLARNVKGNTLVVTKNKEDLYQKELTINKVRWVGRAPKKFPFAVKAKIRYRQEIGSVQIASSQNGRLQVFFKKPQWAVAPGQAVVFYRGQELLGGGIIG